MRTIRKEVEEYLNYCEKVRGMSRATLKMKRNVLTRFAGEVGVRRLGRMRNREFDRWVEMEKARGISARTMNMYIAIVMAMVRYYRARGERVSLDLGLVRKMKEGVSIRKFYTEEQVLEVLRYADLETGLMIRIMFETGMRIAELARLRLTDFSGRRVEFVGKGRKWREAYISAETYKMLEKYIKTEGVRDYLWRCGEREGAITTEAVRKRLKRAFLRAGYEGFYPHALRHSFATNLQRKGAKVAEIKEMMGHESIATTERYLHGFEGRMEELFDKYG